MSTYPHTGRVFARLVTCCVTVASTATLLSGCGGDSSGSTSQKAAASSSMSPSKSMSDMNMSYGDPKATPAYKVSGASVVKGAFQLLDTRPPGMDDVKGTAWLAQGSKGTTVTVSLTGLKPGHHYMAHLHAQHCSAADGGEHFQFTKGGAAKPPNEVWLTFTADKSGMGMTTVGNAKKTGKGAVALVVHPMEAMDNRIACADFDF
ncbi:superoxide dismutase family protein [Streptomyces sp. NBC_00078]|uniref:superoxide dismutase family protein n=1 Tax=unclassified Streptomyces TaxID=2593676 RepID=UPI00224F164E|nr:superoxide dismutase family protein [Streptomyces sp. NBC_00078]MCX5423632.1 superoxide dismutase family protein [Streptomyces sp. NBC_00078]